MALYRHLTHNGSTIELTTPTGKTIDVPVTGTAVQADLDDTTPGRLLLAGALGLGGAAREITDLTVNMATGFYEFAGATVTGGPDTQNYTYGAIALRLGSGSGHLFVTARMVATGTNQKAWVGSRSALTGAITWKEITLV